MNNNDVLRRIRYGLNLNDNKLLNIWDLGGMKQTRDNIPVLLSKEDDPNYVESSDAVLNAFLDGLIIYKRGVKDDK